MKFEKIPPPPENPENEKEALLLDWAENTYPIAHPGPLEFRHIDANERKIDDKKISEAEKQNETSGLREAKILEGLIVKESDESCWLTMDIQAFPSSKFDDLFNHTDLLLQWRDDDDNDDQTSPNVLAVDVTLSSSPAEVNKKLSYIIEDIQKKGRSLKYARLENPDPDSHEANLDTSLKHVPSVVIGLPLKGVVHAIEVLKSSYNPRLSLLPEQRRSMRENYPASIIILEEMRYQLADSLVIALDALLNNISQNEAAKATLKLFFADARSIIEEYQSAKPEDLEKITQLVVKNALKINLKKEADADHAGYWKIFRNFLNAYQKIDSAYSEKIKNTPEHPEEEVLRQSPNYKNLVNTLPELFKQRSPAKRLN